MEVKRKKQRLGIFQVFMAAVLWGTAGTFAKHMFNNKISPFDLAQARLTLSFIILLGIIALLKKKLLRIQLKDLPYFITFGIVGLGLNQFTYLFTISLTNVATAIFLQYLGPAFILVFGLVTKIERPKKLKFLALAASTLGGYFIVLGTSAGLGLSALGIVSGLASALLFAFYSIYGKYGLTKYSPWTLITWGFGFGTVAWSFHQFPWVTLANNQGAFLEFLYISVLATALPFGLYFQGMKNLSAFKTGLIATMEPVVGALSAFIFLGEALNRIQILGCIFVLVSVVIIQLNQEAN